MSLSDDSLPISALQHWLFCPRQCALIHVERLWAENLFTAEGRLLHECADDGRKTVLTAFQDRKRVELQHSWLGERLALGLVVQVQAQLLARHLRGDIDCYPSWIWG